MGQTESDYYHYWDRQNERFTSVLLCPTCDAVLCTERLADQLDADTVIGCDDCGLDVTVEMAIRAWQSDLTGDVS